MSKYKTLASVDKLASAFAFPWTLKILLISLAAVRGSKNDTITTNDARIFTKPIPFLYNTWTLEFPTLDTVSHDDGAGIKSILPFFPAALPYREIYVAWSRNTDTKNVARAKKDTPLFTYTLPRIHISVQRTLNGQNKVSWDVVSPPGYVLPFWTSSWTSYIFPRPA